MSSDFGRVIRVSIFGQSHGEAIGAVIDGIPAGEKIDLDRMDAFMRRRAPGGKGASQRKEADRVRIVSGLVDGYTCGAPLCGIIENTDVRSADYKAMADIPRPMHADYPAHVRHGGYNDVRGGGHYSARLTAPLCFAGAVCMQLLERKGIMLAGHLLSAGKVQDAAFDPVNEEPKVLLQLLEKKLPVIDENAGEKMLAAAEEARQAGDSMGGSVELCVLGLPAGIGEPPFGGVENRLSQALYAVPAIKAIDFGCGREAALMRGSEHNDPYTVEDGRIKTLFNRHGGILGGLTTGMPLLLTCHFKPTPTIARQQQSVSLSKMENTLLSAGGRHDPCAALRAVPCVEAAAAIALYDLYLEAKAHGHPLLA
ncbi:MAG: chorismate synthase [Clostridia bacterium]|nr:chorismate synthase [Clostridia bacterium]